MKWFNIAMKKYLDFTGRARRQEYWMFTLYNILYSMILTAISLFLVYSSDSSEHIAFFVIPVLYSLAVFIPSISIAVRRLHDINKSGAWYFISFVPVIGIIWLFILLITDGDHGENQYGPDPKAIQTHSEK